VSLTTTESVRLSLHAGQAQCYASPARYHVIVAGRRWGKTHLARTRLIAKALTLGSGRYWYVAPELKLAKDIFWQDLKNAIDPSWLARLPNETELYCRLRNGAEIRLHGADNPDSLRGRGLRDLVLDEYADMKPEVWTEVLRPALADYRASALFIGTPKAYNHFHDLYVRGQDAAWPHWQSWQFRSVDNPTLDPNEIEQARAEIDPRTFRQEWEASFESMAGRAYYCFSRQSHVRPVTLDPQLPVCVSFDFNVNPATAVIGQHYHGHIRVWREVFVQMAGGEATHASATGAKRLLDQVGWKGPICIYGDSTGKAAKTTGPSDHAVLRRVFPGASWRIPLEQPHVKDRVAAVNARLESADGAIHTMIDPSCVRLIGDLEQVIYASNGDLDQQTNKMLTHISDAYGYWVVKDYPVVAHQTAAAIHVPRPR
jgi:hypothetical protein